MIFNPVLLDQKLYYFNYYSSPRARTKIPKVKSVKAPRTCANNGANFGKQKDMVSHNNPTPRATKELHNKVALK